MAYEKVKLILSEDVAALTSVEVTVIPDANKKVFISGFMGSVQSQNGIILLIWKYGEPDQEILWTLPTTSDKIELIFEPPNAEVDGINKLALVLENNNLSNQYMSGYALLECEDV